MFTATYSMYLCVNAYYSTGTQSLCKSVHTVLLWGMTCFLGIQGYKVEIFWVLICSENILFLKLCQTGFVPNKLQQ